MKLIKQPKRGYCLVTAFAMVLNRSVEDLIRLLGHDGQAIVDFNLEEPMCFRGFHEQELIALVLDFGILIGTLETSPVLIYPNSQARIDVHMGIRVQEWLSLPNRMVLIGTGAAGVDHAVAYEKGVIYDPVGKTYLIEDAVDNHFTAIERLLIINSLT